jgi:hypothetical protein
MSPRAFNQLPKEVVAFLSNPDAPAQAEQFLRDHGGNPEQADLVLNAVEDVALQAIPLDRFPDALKETGIPDDKLRGAAADAATKWLLPIANAVGDVRGAIIRWGGKVAAMPEAPSGAPRSMSAESFAEDALRNSGIQMSDPVMQNRLRLIVISYLKGVRAQPETRAVLTRAKKVGGAELAPADADALLATIDNRIADEKISFENEPAPVEKPAAKVAVRVEKTVAPVPPPAPAPVPVSVPKPQPAAPPPVIAPAPVSVPVTAAPKPKSVPSSVPVAPPMAKPPPVVRPPSQGGQQGVAVAPATSAPATTPSPSLERRGSEADTFSESDAKEIKRIVATKPVVVAAKLSADPDPLVQSIIDATKTTFKDDEERERFSRIVDSRVRDVRDAYETRRQLELPAARGGLGLSGARVAEVSEAMERLVGEHQRKLEAKAKAERETAIAQKRAETANRAQAEVAQEQDALAKRYAALTGKTPAPATTPNPSLGRRGSEANVPLPKGDDRGLAVHPSLARQETQVEVQKMKAAAKPAMSVGSIPPAAGRPQVQDVRFRPRLSGPLEELKNMTVVDLRRLSSDPAQATTKIRAKFALLEDQGYDQKLAALQAWKESPVNRQYLDLTREAVQKGKSVAVVAQERAKNDKGALTPEEIAAMRALNAELRF